MWICRWEIPVSYTHLDVYKRQAYQIGEGDFILASRHIYETYFAPLHLKAHVEYKSKYGAGEPTDIMIDALLADFRKAECDRIIAIGGGAVIDMAKILVLDGNASTEQYFRREVPLLSLIHIYGCIGMGGDKKRKKRDADVGGRWDLSDTHKGEGSCRIRGGRSQTDYH